MTPVGLALGSAANQVKLFISSKSLDSSQQLQIFSFKSVLGDDVSGCRIPEWREPVIAL
jgi:hypothetical protein